MESRSERNPRWTQKDRLQINW